MNDITYTVSKIDGDYAVLTQLLTNDTIQVARALLPLEIDEGSTVLWQCETFSYTMLPKD